MRNLSIGLTIAALTVISLNNKDLISIADSNENKLVLNAFQQEKPLLSFTSSVKFGKQANQLSVLVSTDFSGQYTEEEVKKASWKIAGKDIKLATGEELANSGEIDIQPIIKGKKTYYIAFKYSGTESEVGKPTQRTWAINNVKLDNQDLTSFNIVNSSTNDEKTGWIKSSAGGVVFRPAATLNKSEGWVIIKIANP